MTPTEQDNELRDILSKVLLDGQNQIHDLKDGRATPEQITERMYASLDYWQPKLTQLITADRKRVALDARISDLSDLARNCNYASSTKKVDYVPVWRIESKIEVLTKELER